MPKSIREQRKSEIKASVNPMTITSLHWHNLVEPVYCIQKNENYTRILTTKI